MKEGPLFRSLILVAVTLYFPSSSYAIEAHGIRNLLAAHREAAVNGLANIFIGTPFHFGLQGLDETTAPALAYLHWVHDLSKNEQQEDPVVSKLKEEVSQALTWGVRDPDALAVLTNPEAKDFLTDDERRRLENLYLSNVPPPRRLELAKLLEDALTRCKKTFASEIAADSADPHFKADVASPGSRAWGRVQRILDHITLTKIPEMYEGRHGWYKGPYRPEMH